MIRKDYLMRTVDEQAKFLLKVNGLRLEGKTEETLNEIDNAYQELINADAKLLKAIDSDNLLDFLQNEKNMNNQFLKFVAELHFEEGQIYLETGDPISARNVLEKTKVLMEYLSDNDTELSFDWLDKLAAIETVLAG